MTLWAKKRAWTEEEDALLLNCVKRHGEGKWHLVPSRAGLNRCRRSCRLRWMNYLRPNIKRGEFEEDEIDLMVRLHKLLGNKWSLIAGRIPGRTANHVKNYCNTRLGKEIISVKEKSKERPPEVTKVKVIKPHPRTFSKSSLWLSGKATLITCAAHGLGNNDNDNDNLEDKCLSLPLKTEVARWEGFSGEMDNFDQVPANWSPVQEDQVCKLIGETLKQGEEAHVEDNERDHFSFDVDLWNHLTATPYTIV